MMVAMELVKNRRADMPDADLTKAVVQAAGRRGLILLSCGLYSNVIRILAPLTIPEAQLEEGLDAAGAVAGRGNAGRDQRRRLKIAGTGPPAGGPAAFSRDSRGLKGANTPSALNSNNQACSVQSLKSWFASHWSAKPKKPSGAFFESANGTAYSTATSLRGPPQGSSAYTSSSGLVGFEARVDQRILHVVPAHVRHEQADVVVALLLGLRDVDESRRGVAHLVELQHRKRRRLESLALAGIVVAMCEGSAGEQGSDEPQ